MNMSRLVTHYHDWHKHLLHKCCRYFVNSPNIATMPPPGVCLNILEARRKQSGHGNAKNPEKFLQQDYEQLKQYCQIQGLRYIDQRFPPDRSSIGAGILIPSDLDRVVWLRPTVSSAALCLSKVSSWENLLFSVLSWLADAYLKNPTK